MDTEEIKKSRDFTLDTAYGHEQRHVKNFLSAFASLGFSAILKEKKEFATCAEAEQFGKDAVAEFKKYMDNIKFRETAHLTRPEPLDGEPYDPIGTRPPDPVME